MVELELLIFLKAVTGDDCCGVTFPLPPLTEDARAECRLTISRFPVVMLIPAFDCPNRQYDCCGCDVGELSGFLILMEVAFPLSIPTVLCEFLWGRPAVATRGIIAIDL